VLLGGVAKVNATLVMVLRDTSQAFLALLLVMDLKPPHLVIALGNANRHLGTQCFKYRHLSIFSQLFFLFFLFL
jgi:hypothetical protein